MEVNPDRLLSAPSPVCYLYGEDRDALFEAAEQLLAEHGQEILRLRVDISELDRIQTEMRNTGLFGPHCCHALIRNAEAATPKQGERLLALTAEVEAPHRLIICAPAMSWKKALHKKLLAAGHIAACRFRFPDQQGFTRWLGRQCHAAGVTLEADALAYAGERLFGMREAARQLIERLQWYRGNEEAPLTLAVVMALLGEKSPEALEDWCHVVAMRDAGALSLTRALLYEEGITEVQMISWLGTRMQQLLMYRWFRSQRHRNALQAASVFGEARKRVGREAGQWAGPELVRAVERIVAAEKQLKGAALEENAVIVERLALDLVMRGRL